MTERTQPLYALREPERDVNLVVVYNPFDVSDQGRYKLEWGYKKTLSAYLEGLPEGVRWAVTLNAEIIEPERFATVIPEADDFIVLVPVPLGKSGGGKMVIRMVALLAVAIVAPYAGAALGASVGTALGVSTAVGTAIATGVIGVAGSMLVNALMPPAQAKDSAKGETADSPTYGLDGAKNTSTEDIVVPVVYGEFRTAGNIASSAVVNDGDTQYLTMQINVSEGPIEDIVLADTLINDQPIANFSDVQIDWRRGDATQALMPWFEDTVVPVNRQVRLTTDWADHRMLAIADRVRLDFSFTEGLFRIEPRFGEKENLTVTLAYEYREVGSTGAWTAGSPLTVTAKQRTALRRSVQFDLPTPGIYDIRVRRTAAERPNEGGAKELNSDKVWLTDVNEIVLADIACNYTAYVGLRIKLTDQLGGMPNVTFRVKGRRVRDFDASGNPTAEAFSKNPALIVLDALTNPRYGAAMNLNRFDIERFMEWRDICAAKNLEFNGPFDTSSNVWDALQDVLRCGHAQLIASGTRYSVAIETPSAPVMMFGMGNISKGTFNLNWLSMDDRANEIEVSYYDRDDNWKRNTLRIVDDQAYARGEPQRVASVTLIGCTSYNQAYLEGWMQLMQNRYIRQTASWEAPLEAIACTIGDMVIVQHDMPKWGFAGRTEPGSTGTTVKLDRPVTMEAGKNYRFLVHHAATRIATTTVRAVNGKSILIDTWSEEQPPSRAIWGGKEVRISRRKAGSPYDTLYLDDVAGLTAGSIIEIWTTDYIDEVPVNAVAGEQTQVTLAGSLRQIPADYANWMFGEVGKVKKPFRIRAISYADDHHRAITAIEYNQSVYEDPLNAIPTPNYSSLTTGVPHSVVASVTEAPAGDKVLLSIGWGAPLNVIYSGADIYIGRNGEPLGQVGSVSNGATSFQYLVDSSDVLDIRIVTILEDGRKAIYFQAPVHHYVVGGQRGSRVIEAPINIAAQPFLVATAAGSKIALEITWEHPGRIAGEDTYQVFYRLNNSSFFLAGTTADLNAPIWDTPPGVYEIKVVAYDKFGQPSPAALYGYTLDAIDYISLVSVSNLRLINQASATIFSTPDAEFAWDAPTDIPLFKAFKVDVMVGTTVRRTEFVQDQRYSYTLAKNKIDGDGTPVRSFTIRVSIVNSANQTSQTRQVTVTNPAPALPTGVQVNGLFRLVEFRYTAPAEDDWRGLLIWRSTTTGFAPGPSNLAWDGSDSLAPLPAESGKTYYLRYAAYDAFGKSGLIISAEQAVTTVGIAHEDLVGEVVGNGNLLDELAQRIDLIDLPTTGLVDRLATTISNLGSLTTQVSTEITTRQNADTALANSITTVSAKADRSKTYRQAAEPTTGMLTGDLWYDSDDNNKVYRYSGSAWVATDDARIAAQAALITSETTARADADTALGQRIDTIVAQGSVGFNAAAAWHFDNASAEGWTGTNCTVATQANGTIRVTPSTNDPYIQSPTGLSIDGAKNRFIKVKLTRVSGSTTSSFHQVYFQTANHGMSSSHQKSLSQVISATNTSAVLTFDMQDAGDWSTSTITRVRLDPLNALDVWDIDWIAVGSEAPAVGIAALQAETSARVSAIGAETTARTELAARVTTAEGNISSANAAITSEATTRANADSALSSRITTLESSTSLQTYRQGTAPTAPIPTGSLWFNTSDGNKASRWNGSAWVATEDTRVAANTAAIQNEVTARTDAVSAVANSVSTLQTTVDGHTSSISTQATSIDGIQAKYTVKVDVNNYVSGFGLISTANNGTPTSDFIVSADRFSVAKPGTGGLAPTIPFVIKTIGSTPMLSFTGSARFDRLESGTIESQSLYVGVTNLVIDGPTSSIRVNDGIRDRVRIGKQTDNSYGITITDATGKIVLSSGGLGAGVVSSANMASGTGVNMLYNSDAQVNTDGWQIHSRNTSGVPIMGRNLDAGNIIPGTGLIWWQVVGSASGNVFDVANVGQLGYNNRYPVIQGQRYEASGYAGVWRAVGCNVYIQWFNASGTAISESHGNQVTNQGGFVRLNQLGRTSVMAVAPTGAVTALVGFRATCNATAQPVGMVTQAYLGVAGANQTEVSPWSPGVSTINAAGVGGLGALATTVDMATARNTLGLGSLATLSSVDWNSVSGKTGFAALSQLTKANASTYVANGAFNSAHIETLTADRLASGTILAGTNINVSNSIRILGDPGCIQVLDPRYSPQRERVYIGHRTNDDYGFWLWDQAGNNIFNSSGLNGTFIRDLTVTNGKFANLSVNGRVIEDLSASNSIGATAVNTNSLGVALTCTGKPVTIIASAMHNYGSNQPGTIQGVSGNLISTGVTLVSGLYFGSVGSEGGQVSGCHVWTFTPSAGSQNFFIQTGGTNCQRLSIWVIENRK